MVTQKLKALLKLTRFPLILTAVADSVTGYFLAHLPNVEISWIALGFLAAASACLYAGGMTLNDVADSKRDQTLHPARPLPAKAISIESAALSGFLFLLLGVCFVFPLGASSIWIALLIVTGIFIYNFGAKRWAIPGALVMGAIRGLNLALGWISVRSFSDIWHLEFGCSIALFLYIFILTLISVLEEKEKPGSLFLYRWFGHMGVVLLSWALFFPPHLEGILISLSLVTVLFFLGKRVKNNREAIMSYVRWSVCMVIGLDASFLMAVGKIEAGAGVLALLIPSLLLMKLYRYV